MLSLEHLSRSQVIFSIGGCFIITWSFFFLANVPLLSPFALLGFSRSFLLLPVWWYLGNAIGIAGMFLLGALLRKYNDQKVRAKRASTYGRRNQYRQNTNTKTSRKHVDNDRIPVPIPIMDDFSQMKSISHRFNEPQLGSPANFLKFKENQKTHSPLRPLQPDTNYNVPTAERYVDTMLTSKKSEPSRMMQWNNSRVQDYYPSILPKKPSRTESGNYKSMEAEDVLKYLKIEDKIYDWRANMQGWLDNILRRTYDKISLLQQNPPNSSDSLKMMSDYCNSILSHFPTSTGEYVIHRLKELGQSGCRSKVWKWDKGGDWHGEAWTIELPTDAEVLMKVFCTEMDSKISTFSSRGFTSKYFVEGRFDPKPSRPVELAIYQRKNSQGEAHFELIHKNEVKKVAEGRQNLFEALVLFVYHVDKEKSGYLDQINLKNEEIKLLQILNA